MEPPGEPPNPDPAARSSIRARIQPAAIALGTAAGLCLVASLIGLGVSILSWMNPDAFRLDLDGMGVTDRDARELWRTVETLFNGPIGVAANLVQALVWTFVIVATVQMARLRAWPLAVAASGLAVIPCLSPCCCCVINLPIAVWCLVLLLQSEVRSAFEPARA